MAFFKFYLDAWKFCKDNSIDMNKIERNDWVTWMVKFDETEKI